LNCYRQSCTVNFLQMVTSDVTPTQRRPCRPGRRVAILFVLSASVFCALALADSAWASGSDPSSDPLAGASEAAATAAQAAAPATAADSETPAPPDQTTIDAATQQAATAVANASQNNVQNIVVIIRINSPGDDVINQSNTAISNAVAANNSSTNQGTGADSGPTGSLSGESGTPTTPTSSSTPPTTTTAQEEPVAAAPPADTPPVGSAASPAHKLAAPGSERARPRAFAAAQRPAGDSRHASRKAAAVTTHSAAAPGGTAGAEPGRQVAPREAASAVPRSTSAPRAGVRRTLVLASAPARAHRAAARAGAGAAHLISNITRPPALPSVPADRAGQVSAAVVLTLLAVLLAIVLGVGSTYVPSVRAWAGR
jgi:hypothetical protein